MKHTIYAFISPNIKPFNTEAGTYGILCGAVSALSATIDITLTDENGEKTLNLTFPSSELNVGPFARDPDACQTLIAVDEFNLIGGSFLKHYYIIWDICKQQQGFAPIWAIENLRTHGPLQ